jgi:hypothetical protein
MAATAVRRRCRRRTHPFVSENHHGAAVQVFGDNVEAGQDDGGLIGRPATG